VGFDAAAHSRQFAPVRVIDAPDKRGGAGARATTSPGIDLSFASRIFSANTMAAQGRQFASGPLGMALDILAGAEG
jgi:hypothetical protein